MENEMEQNCPLCGADANYFTVDYGRRKYFHCPKCTYFQISNGAEARLLQAIQNWRDQLAQKAQSAAEGSVLVITLPSNEEKGDGVGLKATFIKTSEL